MAKKHNEVVVEKKHYEAGKIFSKILAGVLSLMMVFGMVATLIYACM